MKRGFVLLLLMAFVTCLVLSPELVFGESINGDFMGHSASYVWDEIDTSYSMSKGGVTSGTKIICTDECIYVCSNIVDSNIKDVQGMSNVVIAVYVQNQGSDYCIEFGVSGCRKNQCADDVEAACDMSDVKLSSNHESMTGLSYIALRLKKSDDYNADNTVRVSYMSVQNQYTILPKQEVIMSEQVYIKTPKSSLSSKGYELTTKSDKGKSAVDAEKDDDFVEEELTSTKKKSGNTSKSKKPTTTKFQRSKKATTTKFTPSKRETTTLYTPTGLADEGSTDKVEAAIQAQSNDSGGYSATTLLSAVLGALCLAAGGALIVKGVSSKAKGANSPSDYKSDIPNDDVTDDDKK